MLNKELLLMSKGEALGKVTIKLDIQESIIEPDVFTVYKFTGSNFSVGTEDIIYAQFRKGEEGVQKNCRYPNWNYALYKRKGFYYTLGTT